MKMLYVIYEALCFDVAQGRMNEAPMRLELALAGLLVKLANHYTTRGALKILYGMTWSGQKLFISLPHDPPPKKTTFPWDFQGDILLSSNKRQKKYFSFIRIYQKRKKEKGKKKENQKEERKEKKVKKKKYNYLKTKCVDNAQNL